MYYNVKLKCWKAGQGWCYTSDLDTVDVGQSEKIDEVVNEYASKYADNGDYNYLDEDYVIVFINAETGEKTESKNLSEY